MKKSKKENTSSCSEGNGVNGLNGIDKSLVKLVEFIVERSRIYLEDGLPIVDPDFQTID